MRRGVALRHEARSPLQAATSVGDRDLLARLRDAIRSRGVLRVFDTLGGLTESLQTAGVDIVIVPSRDKGGRSVPDVVREIARDFPAIAIIAYCRPATDDSSQIRRLAVAGVHEFLFAGDDTRLVLQAVIDSARRECAAECVLAALQRVLPAKVRPFVDVCLAASSTVRCVEDLAAMCGLHRKTLYNQCRESGSPLPSELLVWCRLALAAHLLATSGRTVESIANELEFASATALRNLFKRYVGLRAGEIRSSGGLTQIVSALGQRIHAIRRDLHVA